MTEGGTLGPAAIRTPDQRLRVFVSSPLEELATERGAAREAIEQLRLTPVMFESGARPHPAQDVYRAYLDQSDIFVGIYWQQYGWMGPGMSISGLEDEFRLSAGMPRLLYLKTPAPDREPALDRMLAAIRTEGGVSYKSFTDAEELRELLVTDLVSVLTERFEVPAAPVPAAKVRAPVTPLVGREDAVRDIAALLETNAHRLVVLTGAGGIGKTRLALAVLERTKRDWANGTAFVDLSSITDPQLVPGAIAASLGLVVQGRERPLDTLQRRLAGQHMLLVLDNFEQVLDAAPAVATLLQHAPDVHFLVTSRAVLRVRGEQEWRVEPLGTLPDGGTVVMLASAPAVRLFVERVHDVRPDFELTAENVTAVAELCRRLDGLPLALELAAAWMRLLTPQQILERLYERLERPGALVDLPARQQTLTATIEWSYDLLPPPAQVLLSRLSVFAEPFTADATEAVCGWDGTDTTEGLATLLDHSIASPAIRPDGEPGFRLLGAIRRFAVGRLADPDKTLAHLESYLLDVLVSASTQHGAQPSAMRRLDSEQRNLQAVLTQTMRLGRPTGELINAFANVWVWLLVRGHLRRTSALWQQIQGLRSAELADDRDRMAWYFLMVSGMLNDGRFDEVVTLVDEVLPQARRLEPPARLGLMLMGRGIARAYPSDGQARADLEQALAVVRDIGDDLVFGYVASHCGFYLALDGDVAAARELHDQTLAISRSLNDPNQRAEAHYDLAMDALTAGDPDTAESHLTIAVPHYRDIDHRDGVARCLAGFGWLANARGDDHLAAWLAGTAAAARDSIGLTPWPTVTEAERRVIGRVRAALPEAEFSRQLQEGRDRSVEDALARATTALGSVPAATW